MKTPNKVVYLKCAKVALEKEAQLYPCKCYVGMLSAYIRKAMVSCKIPFKIRTPGLVPPTQINH